MLIINCS